MRAPPGMAVVPLAPEGRRRALTSPPKAPGLIASPPEAPPRGHGRRATGHYTPSRSASSSGSVVGRSQVKRRQT